VTLVFLSESTSSIIAAPPCRDGLNTSRSSIDAQRNYRAMSKHRANTTT